MDYTLEEKFTSKSKAQELLERFKKKEKKINFHEKRLNKNTIVFCKNEDRFEEYAANYNNIKNW